MRIKAILIVLVVLLAISISAYFALFTTKGNKILADSVMSRFSDDQNVVFESFEGTMDNGVIMKNLEITNIKSLPAGSRLKAQSLFFKLQSFHWKDMIIELENARLMLPDSDPIVFSGTFKDQLLDVNIYSSGIAVEEVISYFPHLSKVIPVTGDITKIDMHIKDHYLEPRVLGRFTMKKILYNDFVLLDSSWSVDLIFKDLKDKIQLFGDINVEDGNLQTKKSLISQIKGNIKFAAPLSQPVFNLSGSSKIEKTKIEIGLKGSLDEPELSLSSEPPLSRQKLMVMLATGKSWKSLEKTIDTGAISSTELTKDFLDYYFFAGKTNKFAEKLGIYDVSVKFDKDTKGVEAKKGITDSLEVGYGVEQQTSDLQNKTTTQKIQGEYQLTDKLSVGVEREVKERQSLDELDVKPDTLKDDKIYMQYRKSF